MRDPFKISTYTFNKVDKIQHSPYYTTNYDGSILRDKLLMAGVTKSELSTLRWIYKTICWENNHGEKEWNWTDFEEKYKGTYVNLIETIRNLPSEILMYHINTISGMINSKKYNIKS
jgi:hypothetical protein